MRISQLLKKIRKEKPAAVNAPQKLSGLPCEVKIAITQNKDRVHWTWNLVSNYRLSKMQVSQLESLVARYCTENFGQEYPGDGDHVKRVHEHLVSMVLPV
jgi:hypothetical protein